MLNRTNISAIHSFIILLLMTALPIFSAIQTVEGKEAEKIITVYLDADRSRHFASARAIEMGVKTAFHQVDNQLQGFKIKVVPLDHRGNSTRSKLNMEQAFKDKTTLFVMAGMHSPPLIKNRQFINTNKMLTLVPWAAGGPITRYPSEDNWVFRLSIDDTKAGVKIIEYAVKNSRCKTPHLLLEQTPWGESNRNTMLYGAESIGMSEPPVTWFNWSVSEASMRIKTRAIIDSRSDCILFVGNAHDGITLSKAMLSLMPEQRIPIYSHWGITGGQFHKAINYNMRSNFKLFFIQTCFSFVSSPVNALSKQVFSIAQSLFPEINNEKSLFAPAGFIHAYDLSKVLIQAASQIKLSANMKENRRQLKHALENLNKPIEGLIKTYDKPFSKFNNENKSAHEALDIDDICMAQYGPNDEIRLIARHE